MWTSLEFLVETAAGLFLEGSNVVFVTPPGSSRQGQAIEMFKGYLVGSLKTKVVQNGTSFGYKNPDSPRIWIVFMVGKPYGCAMEHCNALIMDTPSRYPEVEKELIMSPISDRTRGRIIVQAEWL